MIKDFVFGDIVVRYFVSDDNAHAEMVLLPIGTENDVFVNDKGEPKYEQERINGSLVHLQLSHHNTSKFSNCYKLSDSLEKLFFKEQKFTVDGNVKTVITTLEADEGYGIDHVVKYTEGDKGLEIYTEFYNISDTKFTLEYLTSASLDCLSPYLGSDSAHECVLHSFRAGWAMEAKYVESDLVDLSMEKAWGGCFENMKFGVVGSRPVQGYHPYFALEDRNSGVIWGMYLAHNASWQCDLTRANKSVSLSMGIADVQFGAWRKDVLPGERFTSPSAYVSACRGGIAEISNRLIEMRHGAIDAYGEKDDDDGCLPIVFNEFITTWGHPTHELLVSMAERLRKIGSRTKYFVMDAGWYPNRQIGDYDNVDAEAFPKGLKAYADDIKARGFVPGIWYEFEATGEKGKYFGSEYDDMKVKKDGHVVVGHVINGRNESFLDMTNPKAIAHLDRVCIGNLKEWGFGYLKVDYNASIGLGCDGFESPGEGVRQQMIATREYFKKIKNEIPSIIIENCASGGCRLEPSMMDITAMSSCSDTHEVLEIPIVAGGLHYLIPPRQSQVWCSLQRFYPDNRTKYIIAGGFLGRLCWSGKLMELSDEQYKMMVDAEKLYVKASPVIKHGTSYIHATDRASYGHPSGTQIVLRYSEDKSTVLAVIHSMHECRDFEVSLEGDYEITDILYPDTGIGVCNGKLFVKDQEDISGNVVMLKKR